MACVSPPDTIAGRSWAEIYLAPKGRESDVILHVYDIGRSSRARRANRVLEKMGIGAFHASVEVYGKEWSFAGDRFGTGVYSCLPVSSELHTHHKSLRVGRAKLTELEVSQIICSISSRWPSEDYDVVRRNCCHFVDDFMTMLGVGKAPRWLLRSSGAAARLTSVAPRATAAFQRRVLRGAQPAAAGHRPPAASRSSGTPARPEDAQNRCEGLAQTSSAAAAAWNVPVQPGPPEVDRPLVDRH